jgi:hypothetical protein
LVAVGVNVEVWVREGVKVRVGGLGVKVFEIVGVTVGVKDIVQVKVGPLIVGVIEGVRVCVGVIVYDAVGVKVGVLQGPVTEAVLLVTGPPVIQLSTPASDMIAQLGGVE